MEEEVDNVLDDGQLEGGVMKDNRMARGLGIEPAPSYLVRKRWFVGGMQRPEIFLGSIGRVVARGG